MTQPSDQPAATPTGPLPPTGRLPSATPPPRRGCGSQLLGFIGWLLTLAVSAALGIAALAAIAYFVFGFTLATPAQIQQASADVSTLQGQARTLSTEVALARTAASDTARDLSSANERVGELESRLAGIESQASDLAGQSATAVALGGELQENVALAATIQAEGREGQLLVAVVATMQADNARRLDDLQRRSERINRFLTRLSDLAGDLSADDQPAGATPTPAAEPTVISEEPTPTPTQVPTPTP